MAVTLLVLCENQGRVVSEEQQSSDNIDSSMLLVEGF